MARDRNQIAHVVLLAMTWLFGIGTFVWCLLFSMPLFSLGVHQKGGITSTELVSVKTSIFSIEESFKLGLITLSFWLPQAAILSKPFQEGARLRTRVSHALIIGTSYWVILIASLVAVYLSVPTSQAMFSPELRQEVAANFGKTIQSLLAFTSPIAAIVCAVYNQFQQSDGTPTVAESNKTGAAAKAAHEERDADVQEQQRA